jgi:hypothetical protein
LKLKIELWAHEALSLCADAQCEWWQFSNSPLNCRVHKNLSKCFGNMEKLQVSRIRWNFQLWFLCLVTNLWAGRCIFMTQHKIIFRAQIFDHFRWKPCHNILKYEGRVTDWLTDSLTDWLAVLEEQFRIRQFSRYKIPDQHYVRLLNSRSFRFRRLWTFHWRLRRLFRFWVLLEVPNVITSHNFFYQKVGLFKKLSETSEETNFLMFQTRKHFPN